MERIDKKEAERIMEKPGETRGASIEADLDFIEKRWGKEGVSRIKRRMKELGFPLPSSGFKRMKLYSLRLETLVLKLMEVLFSPTEKDLQDLGTFNAKRVSSLNFVLEHLASLEGVCKYAPRMWGLYFTIGRLEVEELNPEKGLIVVCIYDFDLPKVYCKTHEAFFSTVVEMVIKKEVKAEETMCDKGYHRFHINWKPD